MKRFILLILRYAFKLYRLAMRTFKVTARQVKKKYKKKQNDCK